MADSSGQRNLTPKQEAFVSFYLGECRLNASKAALAAGYSPATAAFIGAENLKKPQIQEAIQEWRALIKSRGIASLEYRVKRLDDLEQGYWRVIDARKEAYAGTGVIGGDTGLVVLQEKSIGAGEMAHDVEEYVADTAITKEIRAIYDDAAKELGQRKTNIDVQGKMTFADLFNIAQSEAGEDHPADGG